MNTQEPQQNEFLKQRNISKYEKYLRVVTRFPDVFHCYFICIASICESTSTSYLLARKRADHSFESGQGQKQQSNQDAG